MPRRSLHRITGQRIAKYTAIYREARARKHASLRRVCKFCAHDGIAGPLCHLEDPCDLDRVPDETGGCSEWEPRYRTDADDE